MSGRCRRTRKPPTAAVSKPAAYFETFTLAELMRLDDIDFDQLDAFDNDPDPAGSRLWWQLRRLEWSEEDAS